LKTALLFAANNFVGREYHHRLTAAGRKPDFSIAVGKMSEASILREIERTGGKWNPPLIEDFVESVDNLSDPLLWDTLAQDDYLAINGGIGILKPEHLKAVPNGILNVHPGKLPEYRGNSCPEWAVLNNDPVICTAHLIDEGVDTGPIICAREYEIKPEWSYEDFRANLYAHCAHVLIEAVFRLERCEEPLPQGSHGAFHWPPMRPEQLAQVRARFPVIAKQEARHELS
jgi:hypothetical protein